MLQLTQRLKFCAANTDTQIADQLAKGNHSEYKIRVVSILEVLFDLSFIFFISQKIL